MGCVVCGGPVFERHHFRTKKTGGPNEVWNLMHLCRKHHVEIHQYGNKKFINTYERAKLWLIKNGWYQFGQSYRWYHDGLKAVDKVRESNAL